MSAIVAPGPEASTGRILLIEDDDTLRLLETISLRRAGWEVLEALTGGEGVRRAAEALPDVIICDRLLPDLDGLAVIAALAREPATASIPVVIATGLGETADIVAGIAAGAHDYVVKPFKMIELEVRCRAALRVSRQQRLLARSEYELRRLDEGRAAEELRLQLAAIVESSNDAILSKTLDGVILTWNGAAEKLYGYTAAEIVGRDLSVLVPDDRPDEIAAILEKVRRGEATDHFESLRVHKDGSLVPVSLTISPVRDASGKVVGASTIARDTSERDRQRLLETARAEANESNRLKSEFLASMSHEIRTPMTGIVGMTDLLLDTDLDETQRRYLLALRDAGTGVMAIIDDILDLSKIEAGRLELESIDFDIDECVDGVRRLLSVPAHSKGLVLRLDVAPDVPRWVRGDPLRLRQVLINLVGNAVKFTDLGTIAIAVTRRDTRTRFSVEDTGIGIDPAIRAGLLEPFSQASKSTARRFGGTGLGLSICARLVELMGGTMEIESRLNKGSTFWFDVLLAAPDTSKAEPMVESAAAVSPVVAGPRARVLLADDAPINQIVGVALLECLGYSVDVVDNGADAVAAVKRTRYDAVLMDCLMPVMDGYEATARIRDLDGPASHTPIIAITALAMVGDREKCLAAGMDGYVSKPIDRAALTEALTRICPPNPARQEPPLPEGGNDGEMPEGLRQLEHMIGSVAFAEVCGTFLRTCPSQIREIDGAVAAGDVQTTREIAHKLRGSMQSFGAVRLGELAAQLERPDQRADRLALMVAELDVEFARVEDILRRSPASS
jgi:PAS domain S-box-containing protein